MSASDHVQLKMFEKAGILANSYSSENVLFPKDQFIEEKLHEAKYNPPTGRGGNAGPGENTTYESIKKYGVRHPVYVTQHGNDVYTLHHGHHRVYVANDIDPEMLVPITESQYESAGYNGWQDPTVPEDKRWNQ